MTVVRLFNWRGAARAVFAAMLAVSTILPTVPAHAATERALYLYYTHTKETARIVFKRDGRYVQSGLNELNQFLRDWRRNEPAKMDPALFDLVWEVYNEVGATQPINIVSAYRSPATNAMLRQTTAGVAENSQHMRGHAMDFFIPGVPLAKLRAVAMRKQVGGVGYYPTSGSPFVHLDTGSVRAWPRMTRAQLAELFPDGRTMHLPTDGKPLSQQGYQTAMAEWKQCHSYPCKDSSSGTQVASAGSGRTLSDMLFGGGGTQPQPAARAAAPQPTPIPQVQTASLTPQPGAVAPAMPTMRPADLGGPAAASLAVAAAEPSLPFSTTGSAPLTPDEMADARTIDVAMPTSMPSDLRENAAVTALAALTAPTMPTPRVLMSDQPVDIISAYAPASGNTGSQANLEAIIASENTASARPTPLPPLGRPVIASAGGQQQTAALAPANDPTAGLFRGTFGSATEAQPSSLAAALAQHVASRTPAQDGRAANLVAPDFEHVADVFTVPDTLSSDHFAVIFDRDEADFDPTPEMGRHVLKKGIGGDGPIMAHDKFTRSATSIN